MLAEERYVQSHASKLFARVTGFDVGEFLVDLYYDFDNSTKRQALLKEFCTFVTRSIAKFFNLGPLAH